MGAQLSRIGAGRSILVVAVCAVLSLTGLTRSGIAGGDHAGTTPRNPEVLSPLKVKDPELGGDTSSPKTAGPAAAEKQPRTKTCVTVLGQKIKVPRSYKCPKATKFKSPAGQVITSRGTGNGGSVSPPASTPKYTPPPTTTTPKKSPPAKTPSKPPTSVAPKPPVRPDSSLGAQSAPND